jgi:hypothetical protein
MENTLNRNKAIFYLLEFISFFFTPVRKLNCQTTLFTWIPYNGKRFGLVDIGQRVLQGKQKQTELEVDFFPWLQRSVHHQLSRTGSPQNKAILSHADRHSIVRVYSNMTAITACRLRRGEALRSFIFSSRSFLLCIQSSSLRLE